MLNIDRDLGRFKDIVKGRIRRDLRKYMGSGELIGRQGKGTVSIPLPQINVPRLRYGDNKNGAGQGEGDEGDSAGQGQKPGDAAGEHVLETEITVEDLARILGEELELPRIEPRGRKISSDKVRYTGIAPIGPESLRHNKRTYKQALKRSIAAGEYDPSRPRIVPRKEDKRYRTFEVSQEPRSSAVIIYMMDVSGSMGDAQKRIARNTAFWIDTWLKHNYDDVVSRFIVHDSTAKEVDRDTFFRTRESGGTLISSAYQMCADIVAKEYPKAEWNIYPIHFSDGDNWSGSDTTKSLEIVRSLTAVANQFTYIQVESQYGSGEFHGDLAKAFPSDPAVVLAKVADDDGVLDAIRTVLGSGR